MSGFEATSDRDGRRASKRPLLTALLTVVVMLVGAASIGGYFALRPAPSVWGAPHAVGSAESGGLQAVSCGRTTCLTVDFDGHTFRLRNGGWTEGPMVFTHRDLESPSSVSCSPSGLCVVSGDQGDVAVLRGSQVRSFLLDPNAGDVAAVSCASDVFCMAISSDLQRAYIFDGRSWSRGAAVPGLVDVTALSCPTTWFCVAADDAGNAALYRDHQWHRSRVPAFGENCGADVECTPSGIGQLSCPSPNWCGAISFTGQFATLLDGSRWAVGMLFEGDQNSGYSPTMLSCPQPGRCVAASTSDELFVLKGGRWRALGYPARQSAIERLITEHFPSPAVSVSCLSPTRCVAVDGDGNAYLGDL